jgi:hypothetical protein
MRPYIAQRKVLAFAAIPLNQEIGQQVKDDRMSNQGKKSEKMKTAKEAKP